VRAGARLQVIGRYGIGVDNIAVEEATRLGIPVTNVPGYCAHDVAEHALALIFALERSVVRYDRGVRAGDWTLTQGLPMRRMAGRTLGIVGLGLRVVVSDPTVTDEEIGGLAVERVTVEDLAASADYVSIHAPLTEATRGLVDRSFLRRMRQGSFLVNTARGAIVDHDSLHEALAGGWIAGAGIDVFEPEHLPEGHPLLSLPNLVATPHVAFCSEESVLELEIRSAENVAAILDGRRPEHVVNPEVLALPRWADLR
jgi:D-3-phosphoglycerate dehydrogenase